MADWKKALERLSGDERRALRDGIRILARAQVRKHPQAVHEQPFDSLLLQSSRLYKRSRERFLIDGGTFFPTLVSSERALTSPALLDQEIQYTPKERELIWSATDPIESANPKKLIGLLSTRLYCTSLFHEQNHRVLWRFLPPPPRFKSAVSRYLNFVESLVVALDMALGDELGPGVSRLFYLAGITYDGGTTVRRESPSRRAYRNYLHACVYATYLHLELYSEADVRKAVSHLYPNHRDFTERAIRRSVRLDRQFVQGTNPNWQRKHARAVIQKLARARKDALVLPPDPLKNHLHYLWAERWFEKMGV